MGSAIELGQLIRNARVRKGWQQQELADKLGVAPGYVSSIEGGKRNWPQTYISDIAKHLGLTEIEMAVAAGLISDPELPKASEPDDPRQQLYARIDALPWIDGVSNSLEVAVSILERQMKLRSGQTKTGQR